MDNKVFAVIVTYNPDLDVLKRQQESLVGQAAGIVYVDNGSANYRDIERLCFSHISSFNNIFLISNDKNMGLGYAQNRGIDTALTHGASHILLLDHDSVLDGDFVDALLAAEHSKLSEGIKLGAVGPIFFNPDNNHQYPISVFRRGGLLINKVYPTEGLIHASFIIASGSLIRKEVLDEVGLMDEGLFVDFIDQEWSLRAASMGYSLVVNPQARMSHIIGDSRITFMGRNISNHSPLRRYYLCRNSILTFKYSYVPFGFKTRAAFLCFLRMVIMSVKSDQKGKYFKYCIRGFYDGFRGRDGECPYVAHKD